MIYSLRHLSVSIHSVSGTKGLHNKLSLEVCVRYLRVLSYNTLESPSVLKNLSSPCRRDSFTESSPETTHTTFQGPSVLTLSATNILYSIPVDVSITSSSYVWTNTYTFLLCDTTFTQRRR